MTTAARLISALLVAPVLIVGASASAASTWTDPVGDVSGVPPAPDIASMAVTETRDRVTVAVRFDPAGAPYSYDQEHADFTSLLVDRNGDGRQGEDDFVAAHVPMTPSQATLVLLGTPGGEPKRKWTLRASGDASSVAVTIPKIVLGNPGAIRLSARVDRAFGARPRDPSWDACPNAGTYATRLTPLALRSLRLPAAALQPRAGRILSLSGILGVTVTGKRVALTRVSATARLRGRTLRPVARGAVSWRIPGNARGTRVLLRVQGRFGAATKAATWRLAVR